ncbi:MAG TPA: carboxypeptidase regulatory-like domain-containing protein [Candidatus Acidoferrales bacterium]|nr:carboxypeptidase regulatory-like domain-containing protein [Candidatus Acidoferrales bacterium]
MLALPAVVAMLCAGQSSYTLESGAPHKLAVVVTDENGVAVARARVQLRPPQPGAPLRCETDFAGRCKFEALSAGAYDLTVDKTGFYASSVPGVQVGATANVDVTLSHQQAVRETVEVVASGPTIDPSQVASKDELTGTEMVDVPYPGPHDYHGALNFIPGVTPDGFGQLHVAGAEGYQTLVLLDGFNVSQPTNGQLAVRTSIESFRSMEVTPSREPAELGKGSGGVIGLNTAMGRDQYRFTSTDFVPAVWTTQGRLQAQWTPIDTFSGPIIKGKAWFIDALDGEFDDNVDTSLPVGKDRDYIWRADNLAKVQANLTNRNILTASFLSNYYHDKYSGLGFLVPQSATPTEIETAYFGSLKDQYYFHNGTLLETGFGVDQYDTTLRPQGDLPYIELFFSAAGNYYLHEDALARRAQGMTNLYLPPHEWLGRHDVKVGFDVDRLSYNAQFLRQPISFEQQGAPGPGQTVLPCNTDANGVPIAPYTCTRYSTFSGGAFAPSYNAEASVYVEDRWLIGNRLLIEPGLRLDWDELVRTPLLSPRLAGTFRLDAEGTTKFSAGIGIIYDATNLGLIHQPLEGQRTDYFFKCVPMPQSACGTTEPTDPSGNPTAGPVPVPTTFEVDRSALDAPRYVNSSISLEKKLPFDTFLKLECMDKRGTHAFAYNTLNGAVDGVYLLGNQRDDRYDAFTVSLRHRFHGHYEVFGAYTRSKSRSNQIFDFSLDIPLLSPQLPGPYPWDTPNRFVGWGVLPGPSLPVIHKFDIVYSAEARTGLPFYGTTDQGEIAAGFPPGNSLRLPTYYTLNLQAEKRVHLFGRYWAGRIGFNNITNHPNVGVISNIDSTHPAPTFFDSNGGRAFALRIMLLGKDK